MNVAELPIETLPDQPLVGWEFCLMDEMRRAVAFRLGCSQVSDEQAIREIRADLYAVVNRWDNLGRWLERVERADARPQHTWSGKVRSFSRIRD